MDSPPPATVQWTDCVQEDTPVPRLLNDSTDWGKLVRQLTCQLKCYLDLFGLPFKYYKMLVESHVRLSRAEAIQALLVEVMILHAQGLVTFELGHETGQVWCVRAIHVPASTRATMDPGYFPPRAYFRGLPAMALSPEVKTHRRIATSVWRHAGFVEHLSPDGGLVFTFHDALVQPVVARVQLPSMQPLGSVSLSAAASGSGGRPPHMGQGSAFTPFQPRGGGQPSFNPFVLRP
jgi:hypothetical protein